MLSWENAWLQCTQVRSLLMMLTPWSNCIFVTAALGDNRSVLFPSSSTCLRRTYLRWMPRKANIWDSQQDMQSLHLAVSRRPSQFPPWGRGKAQERQRVPKKERDFRVPFRFWRLQGLFRIGSRSGDKRLCKFMTTICIQACFDYLWPTYLFVFVCLLPYSLFPSVYLLAVYLRNCRSIWISICLPPSASIVI